MEFSEKELSLIKEAIRAVKYFQIVAYLLFFILVLIVIASIAGYLDFNTIISPSIIFICIISLFPGLGRGPKYVDLVSLLESKQPKRKDAIETFMEVIKEVNKT